MTRVMLVPGDVTGGDVATPRPHVVAREPWRFATEVLDHLRLPYRVWSPLTPDGEDETPGGAPPVVLVAAPPDAELSERLLAWAGLGSRILVTGGPGALAPRLGVRESVPRGAGYLTPSGGRELFAVGGLGLQVDPGTEIVGWWDVGAPAQVRRVIGRGSVEVWAADVWSSIVDVMQGAPVHEPGVPSPDGSVPRVDGVLRCDDGLVLPFSDRVAPGDHVVPATYELSYPPVTAAPVFASPRADHWRVALLTALRTMARDAGTTLAWVHHWPAGTEAVAHMSHDSDLNVDSHARAALAAFRQADVAVTWCHCHPGGYSRGVVDAIAAAGHEQALHYNAMADTELDVWGRDEFVSQHAWAQELCGTPIISNKNHYTRWEGYDDFYRWCVEAGIRIDESRGPSKPGDAGFPFGTAHLWFPLTGEPGSGSRGERADFHDVLELPLHSQDLGWAMHVAVRDEILDGALEVHGVAHFLFHGPHIEREATVAQAVVDVAEAARARGMSWWTAAQLDAWERARRGVVLHVTEHPGRIVISVRAEQELSEVGVVVDVEPAHVAGVTSGDRALPWQAVVRHSGRAVEISVDLAAGGSEVVVQLGGAR